jgi:multicomponent Na+:H+ antiporter subunit G
MADLFTILAVAGGALLFVAGTLGLLRFPDTLTRLHALTKVDNLGVGLVVLGLMPQLGWLAAAKMLAVWLLVQLSGAIVTQILARSLRDTEERR